MLRVQNLPKKEDKIKQLVADFFGVDIKLLTPVGPENTYYVDLSESVYGQEQFKTTNKYGNGSKPGLYVFDTPVMVYYNLDGKIQGL